MDLKGFRLGKWIKKLDCDLLKCRQRTGEIREPALSCQATRWCYMLTATLEWISCSVVGCCCLLVGADVTRGGRGCWEDARQEEEDATMADETTCIISWMSAPQCMEDLKKSVPKCDTIYICIISVVILWTNSRCLVSFGPVSCVCFELVFAPLVQIYLMHFCPQGSKVDSVPEISTWARK